MKKVILITAAVMLAAVLGSCSKSESGAGDQVTVIFNAMEGVFASGESTLDTVINAGDRIAAPAAPVRDGYTFDCWCVDSYGVTPVSFPALVNTDKVFYARWNVNPDKWLISGMSMIYGNIIGGRTQSWYATYGYDENNTLTTITCLPKSDYSTNSYAITQFPVVFKYDGDNVKVMSKWYDDEKYLTVASMKLKDGQCQSMVLDSLNAEMNFTYKTGGYLNGVKLDTTKKTLTELIDVNLSDFCYSDFKLKCHDTTDEGKDTVWTVSVSYSNSDIRDITGCISTLNPMFLTSLLINPKVFADVNSTSSHIVSKAIPFLFTSPYFETPSAFLPKGFSILGEDRYGMGVGTVMTLRSYNIDREEGYIDYISYYSPGDDYRIDFYFTYTEKK